MPKVAPGLPDPAQYGDHTKLPTKQLVRMVIQKHLAERAGPHYDLRIGTPETGLLSWAVRKGMPEPGQKHLAVQQPLHDYDYGDFQGKIEQGYGKGEVKTHDKGDVLIHRSSPNAVHFTVAHKGTPERFALVHTGMGKDKKGWLLMNLTPSKPIGYEKKHYIPVSAERAEKIIAQLPEGGAVQPKVDGAAILMPLLKDKIEAVSYRTSKRTGGPIVHTERLFGTVPNPHDTNMPKELEGTLLRGEAYGVDRETGKTIHPATLGGLLNASVSKSLRQQQEKGIDLRAVLFDIERRGKEKVDWNTPYQDRYKMLQEIAQYLPKDQVHVVEQATSPEAAKQLWDKIKGHEHPLSQEGAVIHPPTGRPMKVKLFNDYDVHISNVFPGEGKYKGTGAGGFEYALQPGGPTVGRVGTGFSDQLRQHMWQKPDDFIGRVAKITAQEQLPSGAYRAPAFWALHEDYPTKQAGNVGYNQGAPVPIIPSTDKPSWVHPVMQNYVSTAPPSKISTRSPGEITDAADYKGVAPFGLASWQRMVNFHRNRGGKGLAHERLEALTNAVALLSQRIKERRMKPDMYDPKTLLPLELKKYADADKPKKESEPKPGPQQAIYAANLAGLDHQRAMAARNADWLQGKGKNEYMASSRAAMLQRAPWVLDRAEASLARQYNNPYLRWGSDLAGSAVGEGGNLLGLLMDIGAGFGNKPVAEIKKTRDAYKQHIEKYEEKDRTPEAKLPKDRRLTAWQGDMAGLIMNLDKNIATHSFNRHEHPLNYWLNPFVRSGPLTELGQRFRRRTLARLADLGPGTAAWRLWLPGALAIPSLFEGSQSAADRRARMRALVDRELKMWRKGEHKEPKPEKTDEEKKAAAQARADINAIATRNPRMRMLQGLGLLGIGAGGGVIMSNRLADGAPPGVQEAIDRDNMLRDRPQGSDHRPDKLSPSEWSTPDTEMLV